MKLPSKETRRLFEDDRGSVYGAFDNMHAHGIKRTYVVSNWSKGMIRAWHGHKEAETYIHVVRGAAKVAAVDMEDSSYVFSETLSERMPALFHVPKGYYNGTMSLEDNTVILVYSTITLEECRSDDFRADWKDIHPEIWEVKHR